MDREAPPRMWKNCQRKAASASSLWHLFHQRGRSLAVQFPLAFQSSKSPPSIKGDDFHHKGWHSRGYIPHLDAAGEIQALTFRLADAMPSKIIQRWKLELQRDVNNDTARKSQLHKLIARYEDAGHGTCELRDPVCAEIVQKTLLHFDGERYRLLEWCIMPNHVHVMIHCRYGHTLGEIVRSWKTYSARGINQHFETSGPLWAVDYFDRYIRDLDHLADARIYIRNNPVKAGLCKTPEDWPWSSAYHHVKKDRE